MAHRRWSRLAWLAAVLLLVASPARAQGGPEEDVHWGTERTLHGCYRFICINQYFEAEVVARGTLDDPLNEYSWWGGSRQTSAEIGAPLFMLELDVDPLYDYGSPFYVDPTCCGYYFQGPDFFQSASVLVGENGGITREEAFAHMTEPAPTTATYYVYTPRPGRTPPPGTTDFRPYSIKYTLVIGEHGLVRGMSSVPEPATPALTAGGLLALAAVARRRVAPRGLPRA